MPPFTERFSFFSTVTGGVDIFILSRDCAVFELQIFCFPNELLSGCADTEASEETTADLTGLSGEQDPTNFYNIIKAASTLSISSAMTKTEF